MAENIDDYLEKGMYGAKEINPAEKKKYLGTYRERVLVALTKEEVLSQQFLPELEKAILGSPDSKLLLNGLLHYNSMRPYIKLAEKCKHEFSIVSRLEGETDLYLVLACQKAINKEDIHLYKEETPEETEQEPISLLEKVRKLFD
ncbi:YueI family protein [Listeria seeligeri]|uniref:YueI family protein n=1 Tax=Listeria seeligeri TaxID=1640 RepID=UPI0030CDC553